MEDINIRFRNIREYLGKSQEEMGEILGITKSGISNIETGKRSVTEKHIKLICIEPIGGKYVNEKYLRTGEGEMFMQPPEEEETASLVSDLLEGGKSNPFYKIILEIMHTYNELSPKSQEILRESSAKLLENLGSNLLTPTWQEHSPTDSENGITELLQKPLSEMTDAEVQTLKDEFNREIDEEKEAEEKSSAFSVSTGKSNEKKEVG